jgi:hypothetical protein
MIGEEPLSTVEVVENAGDAGASRGAEPSTVMPPCAIATGGGEKVGEDSLGIIAGRAGDD